MEETAHVYLGQGRRAGVTDAPQVAGKQAEVTNEFIYKHWDMFRSEAETTLRALNRNAPPPVLPPRLPPAPRSGRTTAPIRVVDAADIAGDTRSYADRILNHSTPDRYLVMDPANPRLKAPSLVLVTSLLLTLRAYRARFAAAGVQPSRVEAPARRIASRAAGARA